MSEFPIELLIKQTLRSVVFDSTNMGIMSSKAEHCQTRSNVTTIQKPSVDNAFWNILRSPETLKLMYDDPSEHINKLFENDSFKESIKDAKDENEIQLAKDGLLYSFLKDIRDSRPPPAMEWVAFQHYMYFIYRHFISPKPITTNEILPNIFIKKMYELVVSLTHEDKTQFYVRIVTLLREYVMTAKCHFESIKTNSDSTVYLTCLLSYYSAFCSAANKLSVVLAEFDQFINNRFHVNWYCLNQRIFFQYFFMCPSVQSKVQNFNELLKEDKEEFRKLLESYNGFVEDMTLLDRHWEVQRRRITILSERNNKEECQWLQKDWKMFNEITKIMKTNYWIIRNEDVKAVQDMDELDGHILALVGDTWHIAERIMTPHGYCICEDCMTAEFRANMFPGSKIALGGTPLTVSTISRLMICYICHDAIALEALASHIVTKHADLNIPRADTTKTYKWHLSPPMKKGLPVKRPSTKLCKVLSETMELAKQKDAQIFKVSNENIFKINSDLDKNKEALSKRLMQHPATRSSIEAIAPITAECKAVNDPILCKNLNSVGDGFKISIEPVIKIANEAPKMDKIHDETSKLTFEDMTKNRTEATNCAKIEEQIFANSNTNKDKIKSNEINDACFAEKNSWACSVQKSNGKTNEKIPDATKNGTLKKIPDQSSAKAASVANSQSNCASHVCGHKCKEEGKYTCDHKESKKCDCAYCEVFGTTMPSHTIKTNETRDRLRTRLNQRKQKFEREVIKKVEAPLTTSNQNIQPPKLKVNKSIPVNCTPPVTNNNQGNPKTCVHEQRATSCQNCVPLSTKACENSEKCTDKTVLATKPQKPNTNDINELLNFIEGNKNIDKLALAQKKAAKKARQKLKKEQEKQRKEEEELARQREEERIREEKRREEERLKAQALARLQAEKLRKNKKTFEPNKKQDLSKSKKKKKNKQENNETSRNGIELMVETIPAMVTIKRVVENNNCPPTVTITLKGSTPDQDKLLYTLVNGHSNDIVGNKNTGDSEKRQRQEMKHKETSNGKKNKNKKKEGNKNEISNKINGASVTSNELKVTLAVDKSFRKSSPVETVQPKKNNKVNSQQQQKKTEQKQEFSKPLTENDLDIPSLRLPPGITITKVNGPITNKTCKSNGNMPSQPYQNVPVNKSGVIVVETEKLIQQSLTNNVNKKNKKKKNKKADSKNGSCDQTVVTNDVGPKKDLKPPKMVTLKNPIFHNLRSRLTDKVEDPMICRNEQASITKGENGMVTIRRPRCIQLPLENESPMSEFLNELMPVIRSEVPTTFTPNSSNFSYADKKNTTSKIHSNLTNETRKTLSAHDILWGLPGIEITKVNKNGSVDNELKKSSQTADVSIIPTNGGEKFHFDKDDWPFESVFTPKDILEEDLDAEERELEAFKRFCQQSVPPKHKEKVAHLNVKDIVLKKKNDVTYS